MYTKKTSVIFICMGNICRSPTAEGVFRKLVGESPLAGKMEIDSAGTLGAHAGAKPDPRAIALAASRGYELEKLRARQVAEADFLKFDYVIAMDVQNFRHLKAVCPPEQAHKIELLLGFSPDAGALEVPDPYYGSAADFEHALELIEHGCKGLLRHITHPHAARPKPPRKHAG
ncbi:MAG: low molecular weight phosphotyrosine protein phosphatase [Betaproteobacteria bacterium]|nr:low molecular weight phosphotyrosine protein phosphatase [Betaproteobacteria bacterium]